MKTGISVRRVEIVSGGRRVERFSVDVPAALNRGKRRRKFFVEESDAHQWAESHEQLLHEHGQRALDVQGLTVNEAVARFLAIKEMHGRHRETAVSILSQLQQHFGSSPVRLISPLDLQKFWTRREWQPTTRVKVFRYVRMLFNWLERYEIIERNPARRVEPPKDDDSPKTILTPSHMTHLLKIDDCIVRAWICLGGFAGLRSSEIQSLRAIDIEETEIRVNAGTREERWVARLPAFDRHWNGLPGFPKTTALYRHLRYVCKQAPIPPNALRHSFGSYHLAMCEDVGRRHSRWEILRLS